MLSQNPSEQMSDEMQQLVRAIEESKKSQEAAAVKTREEQDLELAMNLSKIDFKESLASYASMNAHSAKSIEPVKGQLRPIVVDGNNVGFAHGNHQSFSARGLQICLEYFIERGHEVVIVATEKRMIAEDREICKRLSDFKCLVWAPKRATNGYSHYDDNFIINYAITKKAIVVSNDRFRDLRTPETEEQIRDRTLSFMFVNDTFLPATDPKGRGDPTTLDEFLRF